MTASAAQIAKDLVFRLPMLATPAGAFDQCLGASHELVRELAGHGVEAEVQALVNFKGEASLPRGALPDLWRQLGQSSWCHFVVRVGDKFIDLTARQFDPAAACPLIMSEAELTALWDLRNER